MTAQEVIKKFMNKLANHGFAYSTDVGTKMLDAAVKASSRYGSMEAAIKAMEADQVKAEKEAVKEIFGTSKLLSALTDNQRNQLAINNEKAKALSNAFYNDASSSDAEAITVESVIKERKAYIFLEKYCGILLPNRYWINVNGSTTSYGDKTGNVDTGAITGSDAGGDTVKTNSSVVPEIFINTYKASTSSGQKITTGSRDWVVQATDSNDIIISGGADSINAGAGDDEISATATGATITSGAGNDEITISSNVNDITLSDLNADDTLKINGTFEVGSAQIEDSLLVVTDETGKRKIRLGDFKENATNAKINDSTIGEWLSAAGIDLDNLATKNYSDDKVVGTSSSSSNSSSSNSNNASSKSSTSSNEIVEVNLDDVDTSKKGKVKIDGKVVGKLTSTFPNVPTFTRNGLTIHLLGETSDTDGNPYDIQAKTLDELTDDQKTIIAGIFKWWGSEALKLNEESYDLGFNSSTAMNKDIGLYFYDSQGNNDASATVWNWQRIDSDGFSTNLLLNINMYYYNGISSNNMDGSSSKSGITLLDRALAHEFTHAIMAANINFFNNLPIFIKEGAAELTHGIDDRRPAKIFVLAHDATRLADALDLDNSNIKQTDVYASGFMFLRYLAKQAAAQTLPALGDITAKVNLKNNGTYYISGNSTSETASKTSKAIKLGKLSNGVYKVEDTGVHQVIKGSSAVKIVGLTSNDTFKGTSGNDTVQTAEGSNIITGAGNDSIKLYGQYSTVNAGADNDTVSVMDGGHHLINFDSGNNLVIFTPKYNYYNTISGGTGNDILKDDTGNHGHYNYNIDLGDGNNKISFYYGSDLTIKTGTGNDKINIDGGKNNIIDTGDGNDSLKISSDSSSINAGAGKDKIYIYGENDTVYGGAGNDKIFGGSEKDFIYGGDGKDTIFGGAGNDKLFGDAGNDYISGDDGKDVISGGTGNDKLFGDAGNDSLSGGEGNDLLDGGDGKDTLWGGAGNDKLYGGDGDDIFIYKPNEGSDTIFDYESGDMLKIFKANGKSGGSFTSATFSNGNLTLSINGGGSVIFANVNSGDTININNKTYTIKDDTLK